jgi:hypothetical protein
MREQNELSQERKVYEVTRKGETEVGRGKSGVALSLVDRRAGSGAVDFIPDARLHLMAPVQRNGGIAA